MIMTDEQFELLHTTWTMMTDAEKSARAVEFNDNNYFFVAWTRLNRDQQDRHYQDFLRYGHLQRLYEGRQAWRQEMRREYRKLYEHGVNDSDLVTKWDRYANTPAAPAQKLFSLG